MIALRTISPSTRLGKLRHFIAEKHMKRRKPIRIDWHGFILSFFLGFLQLKHGILKVLLLAKPFTQIKKKFKKKRILLLTG